jgi:hypothetical protein
VIDGKKHLERLLPEMRENGLIIASPGDAGKSTYFITEKGKDAIPEDSQGGSFANCLNYRCLIRFLCYRNQMKNYRLRLRLPHTERLSRAQRAPAARMRCRKDMAKPRAAKSARGRRLCLRWAPRFNRRRSR